MHDKFITLAHGSGGVKMRRLIKELFLKILGNAHLDTLADAAILDNPKQEIAFTTDSYVVSPLFFPGGDIGRLSICGTVNDLAVMAAEPRYISCAMIIEEGLPLDILKKITQSIAQATKEAGVKIVTGDVKVVGRGSADKIFINTSGIGLRKYALHPEKITPGDGIILSGTLADHGFTILSERKNLEFKSNLKSDCAPLNDLIAKALSVSRNIKFMRDPTRGGLAAVLTEVLENKRFGCLIEEDKLPLKPSVKALSEILGIDPLYMANEGKVVMIVSQGDSVKVLKTLKKHPLGKQAQIIGRIVSTPKSRVILKTKIGGQRLIEPFAYDQVPRIC